MPRKSAALTLYYQMSFITISGLMSGTVQGQTVLQTSSWKRLRTINFVFLLNNNTKYKCYLQNIKDCPELFILFPRSCLRENTFCKFAKNLWNKKHTHHNSTCVNVHGSVNKGGRMNEGASHIFGCSSTKITLFSWNWLGKCVYETISCTKSGKLIWPIYTSWKHTNNNNNNIRDPNITFVS